MNLQLKLILKKRSAQTIFELHRKDGSLTYAKIQPGMEFHELGHWVVESSLLIENAFYGLVSSGYDISDFDKPRAIRPIDLMPNNLPSISIFVEHYVNLLMTELNAGVDPNFLNQLNTICQSKAIEIPPSLNQEKIDSIRALYQEKIATWKSLELGNELVLWI